jgi:CheY-like chemotaxis protein
VLVAPGAPAAEVPGVRVAAAGLSVVVVDDNEDAGATLAEVLTLRGHRVRVETTGQAGVEAVLATAPDVLLCDISLPDMTGYEVVRAARAAPAARPLVAIAITGHAQPDDLRRAREAGFDAHLAKPMSLTELDSLLASRAPSPR